jgi:hypothetical protein
MKEYIRKHREIFSDIVIWIIPFIVITLMLFILLADFSNIVNFSLITIQWLLIGCQFYFMRKLK